MRMMGPRGSFRRANHPPALAMKASSLQRISMSGLWSSRVACFSFLYPSSSRYPPLRQAEIRLQMEQCHRG